MIETRYEKIGDVAAVTMANPPANTFTMELGDGLEGAVRRAVSEEARALVLQADGPLFCGGADVHIFAGTTAGQAREMFAEGFQLINTLEDAPFPVIAAVHGMCFAAGLELALAGDLIIAAEGAQFAQVAVSPQGLSGLKATRRRGAGRKDCPDRREPSHIGVRCSPARCCRHGTGVLGCTLRTIGSSPGSTRDHGPRG